ncbi:MAG: hypothetical protein EBZ55_02010 [Actinobacteria bacterium]|nr:hypothetical protein [Actinomycetota bacterium]
MSQELVEVFDTTLRDGMQVEGVSATVEDKLRIAEQLDYLGVHFIEGGWPGANPKDIEFFARARKELKLSTSTLVAFGSTRRPLGKVDDDATLRNLIEAETSSVCIVAKAWDYHVEHALQTTLDEGLAMVGDSVKFLSGHGRRVLVDMEHFFDGYKNNPEFSLRVLESAIMSGATIQMKASELGLTMDGPAVNQVIDDLKRLEHEGYHFEAADASLELLMRRATGWEQDFFRVESMRVITDEAASGTFTTEATVKVWVGEDREVSTAEGNGPVNAIDTALRAALVRRFPQLERVHLTDYKVRILDSGSATGAVTRVLIDASDGERSWTTIGVSANIIEASWNALEESLVYGLLHNATN